MSYMQFSRLLSVERVLRLNSSKNGNPRFRLFFTSGLVLDTPRDVSWAYEIVPDQLVGQLVRAIWRVTNSGRTVLDALAYDLNNETVSREAGL